MAIVGAALLLDVSRALARILILGPRRLRSGQPLGLETAHLARRSSSALDRPTANHPPHCRIAAQALGVVHVLVAGRPPNYRLPQQAHLLMPAVLNGARIRQYLATIAVRASASSD
jgi:hypothetical protein